MSVFPSATRNLGELEESGIFFFESSLYLHFSQELTTHLHYFFLKLTLKEIQMRNSS